MCCSHHGQLLHQLLSPLNSHSRALLQLQLLVRRGNSSRPNSTTLC